ncbi:MAG: DUF1361 domain-containing protein [Cyanobacteria bacterium J06623_7]
MTQELIEAIELAGDLFNQSTHRIIWNLFLAFIPLALSFYLFRLPAIRNLWWWILLLIFIAFLPNAPYILTDSIHILELSQQNYPRWAIAIILIPQYILFITLGFEAYVVSLTKLAGYLKAFCTSQQIGAIKILLHSLSIVGVYIGRFERFNSWDFVTKPGVVLLTTLEDIANGEKLISMAIAVVILRLLTAVITLVNSQIEQQLAK